MRFKFCYNKNELINMNQFSDVFNPTHSVKVIFNYYWTFQNHFSLTQMFPYTTNKPRQEHFHFHVEFGGYFRQFWIVVVVSYNTSCFLKGNYVKHFYEWMNNDIKTFTNFSKSNWSRNSKRRTNYTWNFRKQWYFK